MSIPNLFKPTDTFVHRHIGATDDDIHQMLSTLGLSSLDALIDATLPSDIRLRRPLTLGPHRGEHEVLARLRALAAQNKVCRSFIGMGYYDCITPPVVQRNVLENPGWYTQYTPYQAEIAQGRLEALLTFQTMIADLTGLPLSNASLLDEATAAAEAMHMCQAMAPGKTRFLAGADCHPQTLAVLQTHADPLGIRLEIVDVTAIDFAGGDVCGLLLQYPSTGGSVCDYTTVIDRAHAAGALAVVATDLLALTMLRPPGEFDADIAVGSSQRFGVPLGFGGPHAGFMATKDAYKRQLPGRIVGMSKDSSGKPALRLALQTREQHIRRDKATSNICTAQVLLAVMAAMYAVYHGPEGLRRIAERVHGLACVLAEGLRRLGHACGNEPFFDTLQVQALAGSPEAIINKAHKNGINLRRFDDGSFGVSLDEATTVSEVQALFEIFAADRPFDFTVESLSGREHVPLPIPSTLTRTSEYLTHPVFNRYHSEHEMLRYIHRLQARDLSLIHSMIPLGSCTMKLNATVEMLPLTWREFSRLHPFVPKDQSRGYQALFTQLESWLAEITGFAAVSLQPNAGSQGEYAGLMVIRSYHRRRGQPQRDVCLIPTSAHGTNPASAVIAGMKVVAVACDEGGNINLRDLEAKAIQHRDKLAALMITYPSTHGVFEEDIRRVCEIAHEHGAQVYMDGANMNAQVGLCRPGDIGADVCHLNLHKTFCIPHGGGGPGMGPIGVAAHLAQFLPGHPVTNLGGKDSIGPVAAAPYGSPSILTISWVYIALMGADGLTKATKVAILNANYMARRLEKYYPVLYTGKSGFVAHEFILDARQFKESTGVEVNDIAKRLMDYGFHAPTMSFPVPGTLMIEPTESESKAEMDRFCEAMIAIRGEIQEIAEGRRPKDDNVLKNSPHTAEVVTASDWKHPYSREQAAFPAAYLRDYKFWPFVGRIDNAYGDRNLICTCPPMDSYSA